MNMTRIVAVEDERIVALHLKQQLTNLGYEVAAIAASGEKALRDIAEARPDLVLMDIHIEGDMDGIETAGRIPPEYDIPVIYLTAYSEEATLDRARATKPYGFLIKPYSERELHATIQMALERQAVEAALRASEDRFRSIIGAISEGIFIVDAATREIVEVNGPGGSMFGYTPGELIGRSFETVSADDPPFAQAEAWIARVAATGEPQSFEWRCRGKDGRLFWAEISIRFATIGGDRVVLSVVRDQTERRIIEEQLRQAQKMEAIGQLTGGIAHDFNNLLGVVIGNLDLLRKARPDDRDIEELSGDALEAALGGADLTRRLLAFARRQPLQPQRIDLNALVASMVKLLRRVVGENIDMSVSPSEDICSVTADPGQLEAALTNLVTNARDAMPSGGRLLIATGRRHLDADYAARNPEVTAGEYAVIEVTDTGVGMAPEVSRHIFEPFFTTKDRDRGTGLGLSMIFGFLKQSGGHVTVYSEVGLGTTFRLYLPSAGEAAATELAPRATDPEASRGETVLVVEDNAPLRRIAARQLRELGYGVVLAENASEALDQLEQIKVDVLFSDIVMPGGVDGIELARAARARWPDIKVLLTSGFPQSRLADSLNPHAFSLLPKPYRKADLALCLRAVLGVAPQSDTEV